MVEAAGRPSGQKRGREGEEEGGGEPVANAMTPELKAAWDAIRRDFFPLWDRRGLWELHIGECPATCRGYCYRSRRVITIRQVPDDPDQRDRLLIHEICHAATRCGHRPAWLRRMEQAAARALENGRGRLRELLLEEVQVWKKKPWVPTDAKIYGELEDFTREKPELPYLVICKRVAANWDMSLAAFRRKYSRARRVHADARRDALQYQRLRAGQAQRPPGPQGRTPP
jgi:hypothetical protein